ncbi:hypothetical protein BV898_08199 [Hypsibius exemplaris]|uniref:Uncharacterized protein n=1 Tax=Hypsibius exemplaris TaxID=2072580 RepID=A0A1W0WRC9_HYPEX|nr:hypothetical protein BV898_08199 [Hypsibius exemplaris]
MSAELRQSLILVLMFLKLSNRRWGKDRNAARRERKVNVAWSAETELVSSAQPWDAALSMPRTDLAFAAIIPEKSTSDRNVRIFPRKFTKSHDCNDTDNPDDDHNQAVAVRALQLRSHDDHSGRGNVAFMRRNNALEVLDDACNVLWTSKNEMSSFAAQSARQQGMLKFRKSAPSHSKVGFWINGGYPGLTGSVTV